jgi:hypothetical protein
LFIVAFQANIEKICVAIFKTNYGKRLPRKCDQAI